MNAIQRLATAQQRKNIITLYIVILLAISAFIGAYYDTDHLSIYAWVFVVVASVMPEIIRRVIKSIKKASQCPVCDQNLSFLPSKGFSEEYQIKEQIRFCPFCSCDLRIDDDSKIKEEQSA